MKYDKTLLRLIHMAHKLNVNVAFCQLSCHNGFEILSHFTFCVLQNMKNDEDYSTVISRIKRAWLAQLVRSLPSDHKVPSSIPGSTEI